MMRKEKILNSLKNLLMERLLQMTKEKKSPQKVKHYMKSN